MENFEKNLAGLEALLFVHGEPLALKRIGKILNLKDGEIKDLIGELEKKLSADDRGLNLVSDGEKVQLATKPRFAGIIKDFVREELSGELTPAALEVLSLVAYLAPVPRSRLEYIRGVNSSFTLRNLLIRGLVERFPAKENQNVYLYQPTMELLKHLGLKKKEDLPEYEKFRSITETSPEQTA